MKILLIVLGSLFGLMVLAVVGIALMLPSLGKKLYTDAHDPASRAKTLAKIAVFRVPGGYRIGNVTDVFVSQTAMVVPNARGAHGFTTIQLSSQHVPSRNADDALDALGNGFGITAKLMHCDLKREADDRVADGRKTIALRTYDCANGGRDLRFEIGIAAARASTVQIVATSLDGPIDTAAVRSLVSSIR